MVIKLCSVMKNFLEDVVLNGRALLLLPLGECNDETPADEGLI